MKVKGILRFFCVVGLVLLLFGGHPGGYRADDTGLVGRVFHLVTQAPIGGAVVEAGGQWVLTDDQGWYRLPLSPGYYDVRVRAPGYIGMTRMLQGVQEGLTRLDFAMIPQAPDAEMSRLIDEKLAQPQPVFPELAAQAMTGEPIADSGVTSVPRTVRLLVKADPADPGSAIVDVITLDFEEYLRGVVPSEMPPHWPMEALKAQAVAARSYAAASLGRHAAEGADVCSTVHCQAWRPIAYETTDQAVQATRGVVATYNGSIIYAFYHNHCDGHTRNSEDVWSGYVPYCRSVACPCGYTSLSGHGVGMCQYGARALALKGYTYDQILKHYYTGIDLLIPQWGELLDGAVEPVAGDLGTRFVYRVRYQSALKRLPAVANVIIDGRAYAMRRIGGDAEMGWTYAYTTTLGSGAHAFHFVFEDGFGHRVVFPEAEEITGPVVASEGEPLPQGEGPWSFTFATPLDWQSGQGECVAASPEDGVLMLASGCAEGAWTSAELSPGAVFVAYGLLWYAEAPGSSNVALEVRHSLDGETWGAWQALEGEPYFPGTEALRSTPLVFGEARSLQIRVRLVADPSGGSPQLRNLKAVLIDSRTGPQAASFEALPPVIGAQPAIITRAQWGADESLMTWPPEYHPVQAIVLHHTATSDGGIDPAAIVRAIYYYHAVERGWGDIGYNYLIDHDGRIYEGRYGGPGVVGAHAGIYNYGSVGIGMIGNFQENPVPPALYDGLVDFLAYQCGLHSINPVGERFFIDAVRPTILGHRDVASTQCPGDYFYVLMNQVRADTLDRMALDPPALTLEAPVEGQPVGGIVLPQTTTEGVITYMAYYVDDVLRAWDDEPFVWKWNTLVESEGPHTLRVLAENPGGWAEARVTVEVDNTPPSGTVDAPSWTSAISVPVTITATDAVSVAISYGWAWEGEALEHQSGVSSADAEASGGAAWMGRAGQDAPGAWYGPYFCDLPIAEDYQAVFWLKTDHFGTSEGLATLDVADGIEGVVYALRTVAADDFGNTGYHEFALSFAYPDQAASCRASESSGGLEFRTWYSGAGNLWLDVVRVFTAPQRLDGDTVWLPFASEGVFPVTIRLLDQAGNAAYWDFTIGVDRSSPLWEFANGSGYWVRDALSGLDAERVFWAESFDGGQTWNDWQPLSVTWPSGTSVAFLYASEARGTHVRYKVVDLVGNEAVSPPVESGQTPVAPRFFPIIRR